MPKNIADMIYVVREQKVLLDTDLAQLYEVETRILNRSVKRHISKFPSDFMFKLTTEEWGNLRSQIGISSSYGGSRYCPSVFTEYGVAALSGVLNSPVATKVNISIIRTFVNLRKNLDFNDDLAKKILILENDSKEVRHIFKIVFNKIQQIERTSPILPKYRKKIGFN